MSASVLQRLLDDNCRFDLANRGTVNHLPMALVALSRMGASDERLVEYFRWWEENRALPRRDSGRSIDRPDWRRYIGDASMFDALRECFQRWISDDSSAAVIGEVFPALETGVAAAAFHGLIRLAYGIEADHAGEIAAGLAALGSRHVELGVELEKAPPAPSVRAALARIADALGGSSFTGQGIVGRMLAAASDPRFRAAISIPPIRPALLAELADASIALYWQAADFAVLHMVTSCHAARVLFGRFPHLATERALHALWAAACAAYASIGAPALTEAPPAVPDAPPWPQVCSGAVASNDDHVIKMTYTCRCEGEHYGGALYRVAAARLVTTGRSI